MSMIYADGIMSAVSLMQEVCLDPHCCDRHCFVQADEVQKDAFKHSQCSSSSKHLPDPQDLTALQLVHKGIVALGQQGRIS